MRWYEDHVTTDPNMSKLNIQTLDFQIAPPEISTDHRARRKKEGTPSQQGSHGSQSMTPRDEKCTDHSCFIYKYIRQIDRSPNNIMRQQPANIAHAGVCAWLPKHAKTLYVLPHAQVKA